MMFAEFRDSAVGSLKKLHMCVQNTEVFGSDGSFGDGHFVPYSRKSFTLGIAKMSVTEVFGSNGSVGEGHFDRYFRKSVTLGFLMQNFNLGITKMSVTEVFGSTGFGNGITDILAIPKWRFCIKIAQSNWFPEITNKMAIANWSVTSENLCISESGPKTSVPEIGSYWSFLSDIDLLTKLTLNGNR